MTVEGRRIEAVRSFNRFWTQQIGVLQAVLLNTRFSLTEARVIFELAQRGRTDLVDLRRDLGFDAGYVSRVMSRLKSERLVKATQSEVDARRQVVTLTARGRKSFAELDRRSTAEVAAMLEPLSDEELRRLMGAMTTIQSVLGSSSTERPPYVLRPPLPGDLGWVAHRHGVLYAEEYGWDETFEALVSRVVADYIEDHDGRREAAWIAEVDGEPAGCVFCCKKDDKTAQLRLLLVDRNARGLGLGSRLVEECTRFARRTGYERMVLWTNDVLVSARRIYEAAGFELISEDPHHSFGHDLVGQEWALDLRTED